MLLATWLGDRPKPSVKPLRFLNADDSWTKALELGTLAKIFEQDCGNIPSVHLSLKTKMPDHI